MANDRYSRAAIRRKARKPKHVRSRTPMVLGVFAIVLVFGLGIFLTIRQRDADANTAPRAATSAGSGDHWHAYLGVNVCGTWLDNAPEYTTYANKQSTSEPGIHSHGDGLVHIHPFVNAEAGKNATLGKFFTFGGWSISGSSMKLWDGVQHKNGQDCPAGSNYAALTATTTTTASTAPGAESTTTTAAATSTTVPSTAQPAFLVWTVNGKVMSGDPAKYRPKNGDIIAIGFLPKGVALVDPPNAKSALSNISDLGGASAKPPTASAPASAAPTTQPPA